MFIRKSLFYSHKPKICRDIESTFIDILLPKSKSILVEVFYGPPNKPEFIEHLDNSPNESNICNIQECYLIGDFDVNLLRRNENAVERTIF